MNVRMAISTLEKSAKATTERNRVILKCPISVPQTQRDSIGFPLSTVVNRRSHKLAPFIRQNRGLMSDMAILRRLHD